MNQTANIEVYSKPDCSYCSKAKSMLKDRGLNYVDRDVTADEQNAVKAIYLSGGTTVPQIIIGGLAIGGSEDLGYLIETGALDEMISGQAGVEPPLAKTKAVDIQAGAQDVPLKAFVSYSDGSQTDDEEAWELLRFYKQFFGFWPNCFGYMHHWPEAYKLFVYAHNAPTAMLSQGTLGEAGLSVIAWGSSSAHGCNYCMVHSAATKGESSADMVRQLEAARSGDVAADAKVGPYEAALAMLASRATLNTVSDSLIRMVTSKADDAISASTNAEDGLTHAANISGSFGFLNVFNDLTGVEVEGEWADIADGIGVEVGRHGRSKTNPTNLDYDLPTGGPNIQDLWQKYRGEVGDITDYSTRNFAGPVPWINRLPEIMRPNHLYFLAELLGDRAHSHLSAEFKHTLCHVAALGKGHTALAKWHANCARHLTLKPSLNEKAFEEANTLSMGLSDQSNTYSPAEIAALRFARLSTNIPLITPRRFTAPLAEAWNEKEMIEIAIICSLASMLQRMAAIFRL